MAREYARIKLAIWTDPDFRALSNEAQRLYFLLLTSPTINMCGVADWRESRLAALSSDATLRSTQQAAWELGQAAMIAVDPDTEEVLVRSFVRHDGVLKSPNLAKAMVQAYAGTASQKLMAIISQEVRRAADEAPESKGLEEAETVAIRFPEGFQLGSNMVPDWFRNGSQNEANSAVGTKTEGFQLGSEMVPLSSNHNLQPTTTTKRGGATDDDRLPALVENKPPTANAAPTTKKGTRIPENWNPSRTDSNMKAEEGHDTGWLELELARFRDYWAGVAGAKGVKLDWDATWRNWVRRADDFKPQQQASTLGATDWKAKIAHARHLDQEDARRTA